jgi:uridine kinase
MTSEQLSLKPEFKGTGEEIFRILESENFFKAGKKKVISITGESGSGKSITALSLQTALEAAGISTLILHMDNYFRLPPKANHQARLQNRFEIGPDEVQLDLLAAHIKAFRNGEYSIRMPVTNYQEDWFESVDLTLGHCQVLLVEGTYVSTLPELDVQIFLERDYLQTVLLRKARGRDKEDPFVEQVLEKEHRIIRPEIQKADIIIDLHYHAHQTRSWENQN